MIVLYIHMRKRVCFFVFFSLFYFILYLFCFSVYFLFLLSVLFSDFNSFVAIIIVNIVFCITNTSSHIAMCAQAKIELCSCYTIFVRWRIIHYIKTISKRHQYIFIVIILFFLFFLLLLYTIFFLLFDYK